MAEVNVTAVGFQLPFRDSDGGVTPARGRVGLPFNSLFGIQRQKAHDEADEDVFQLPFRDSLP